MSGLWTFQRGMIWAIDLADSSLPAPTKPDIAARFAELEPAATGALAKAMGASTVHTVEQRLSGNRRCFVAWHEEQVVSYCWISQQREHVGEMERTIKLQARDAYVWDCATVPDYRRRGLYTALLGFINRALAAEGLHRIWIGANLENEPSRRAFDAVGFRRVATMTHARLLGLSLYLTTADPRVPAAWVAAARRLFALDGPLAWGPLCLDWRWPEG